MFLENDNLPIMMSKPVSNHLCFVQKMTVKLRSRFCCLLVTISCLATKYFQKHLATYQSIRSI